MEISFFFAMVQLENCVAGNAGEVKQKKPPEQKTLGRTQRRGGGMGRHGAARGRRKRGEIPGRTVLM
ncbi:MAG: hypothetical protein NT005_06535 [Spirochaetes bacterium]|nr:hypothetical protein [Spirochaetota bacterium]